jgi:diguanylate cyclase (GGDEF)-like protein
MRLSLIARCTLVIVATMILLVSLATAEANPLRGSPPITRFVTDLDVYPQNFCVEQDSRHIVYVCNVDGVLEFDGERWKQWRLPNRELVRSLAVSEDDTVYVGGYNVFGYLRRDAAGQATFEDISARFKAELQGREFADIWQTVITAEGIYFRALRDVFFFDPKTNATAHWHHPGRFGVIFSLHTKTYVQFRGEGFKVRDGNQWKLLPSSAQLKAPIFNASPLADGNMLVFGAVVGWFKFDGENMTPQVMPTSMPATDSFTKMKSLADGSIAVLTNNGRTVIVDSALQNMRSVDIESGFLSGLTLSRSGGIFVTSDRALYKIAWPPAWSVLSVESQNIGSLHQVREWNAKRYALTSSGIYQLSETDGGTAMFAATAWPEAHDLIRLDNARALIASTHHLMLIEKNQAKQITADLIYPRKLQRSRFHLGRILLGTENGLAIIDARASNITTSAVVPRDLPIRITDIIEVSPAEVWVGTSRHGVWRYALSAAGEIINAKRMTKTEGLLTGELAEALLTTLKDGAILAATRAGFFKWDGKRFQPDDVNGLAKLRGDEEALSIVNAPNGSRWAYSATRVWHEAASGAWRQVDMRSLRRGAMNNHFFMSDLASGVTHNDHIGFVNSHALLLYQHASFSEQPVSSAKTIITQPPRVQLRSVTRSFADGRTEHVTLTDNAIRLFPAEDFSIRFEFALPEFMTDGARRYQAQLIGHDPAMSDWSVSRAFSYSSLTPGRYTLILRAKDSRGFESEITPYTFEVAPRWYARLWARVLALLCFFAVIWMLIFIYTKHRTEQWAKQNLRLEKSVAERTKELADANRRLDMMAHIDGLTGIPNRRRLDEYLPVVWQNAQAQSKPISILIIDVDNFKQYNDTHGHLAGDELLRTLAERLLPCLRRTEDLLARYGGEEFMVILPGADRAVAALTAENMRALIETSSIGVTISVGVSVTLANSGHTMSDQIRKADEALYMAKKLGRNRVEISG